MLKGPYSLFILKCPYLKGPEHIISVSDSVITLKMLRNYFLKIYILGWNSIYMALACTNILN